MIDIQNIMYQRKHLARETLEEGYIVELSLKRVKALVDMASLYAQGDFTYIPNEKFSDNEVVIWEMVKEAIKK